MAKPTTSGFTISGLLDRSASTRNDYPVERIPIEEIADHPANAAYSMDEAGIAQLAKSIEEEGLTDLPLVRKLDDGGWQMVSGHRRKAAYALLAKEDEKYAQIPCRVIRGITDEQSVMLLHAANYFVRSLTVTERAAASRALGVEVERMRAENPELSGVRTEDIKAAIISEQTGRKVSGKTIQRQESLARKIEERLTPQWREAALADALSADAVGILADLDSDAQDRLHATWRAQARAARARAPSACLPPSKGPVDSFDIEANGLRAEPHAGNRALAGHRQHPSGRYSEMPGHFLRINEVGQRLARSSESPKASDAVFRYVHGFPFVSTRRS